MAIQWEVKPAWKFANDAEPIDISYLWRRYYPWYQLYPEDWELRQQGVEYDWGGVIGFINVYMTGDHRPAFATNTKPSGVYPSCWCGEWGDTPHNYYRNVMTLTYPNAGRYFAMRVYSYQVSGDLWNLNVYGRWFKTEDDSTDPTITEGTLATGLPWETQVMGIPGCHAVSDVIAGKQYLGITMIASSRNPLYDPDENVDQVVNGLFIDVERFTMEVQRNHPDLDFSIFDVADDEFSPEVGDSSSPSGLSYGADPRISDSPHVPDVPSASAAALGFINMYNPSAGGLSDLGEEIFPDFDFDFIVDPTGNTVIDAILNACGAIVDCFNQIPKMFTMFINSRLIDYVQDCHIVPVKPTTTTSAPIKLGFRELDTSAPVITNEYVKVSLGRIAVPEIRHAFMDYLPFTRAKLYLPFVGYVPIEPEYFQDGFLGVEYIFNVYDGSFMAFVTSSPTSRISFMDDAIIGSYTGTAIIHLPLTGLNYSSMVAGLIGGAGSMVSTIASGNPAAAATAALNTAAASPQVMTSNAYTASSAFLGFRYPFLVLERSTSHYPQKYQHDVGLPSKITTKLSAASGMTTVSEVDLSGIGASAEEKTMIRSLLASGVYF